jgi:voltage-gated potassium channel
VGSVDARAVRRRLPIAIPLVVAIVLVAGGALAAIETDTVGSYDEGVWWAVSLMSTVGFAGDTPQTTGGRVVSGFLMVFGFATLSLVTASLASLLVAEEEEPELDAVRVSEREVLAELQRVRSRLESLESRIARPPGGPD